MSIVSKLRAMAKEGRTHIGATCTLDGHPAYIKDWGKFAAVVNSAPCRCCGSTPPVEFSWPTVGRIMSNGGAFKR